MAGNSLKLLEARELRERGWSYLRIAVELGVSQSVVYTWLNPKGRGSK